MTTQQQQLFDILSKGHQQWNDFRKSTSNSQVDLSGLKLSCKDFRNYDFSNCILIKTDFQKSHLGNANFSNTIANASSFRDAYFNKTNFEKSDLRASNFKATIIKYSNFDDCLFNSSDFSGSKMKQTTLLRANIRDSIFCSTQLDNVTLTKAHFERSLFRDAKIFNSELGLVKLNDSEIKSTIIINCKFTTGMLYGSNFDDCKINDSDFSNTLFSGSRITNSEINNSTFIRVDFRHTQLNANTFTNSDLSKSKIFGVSAWKLNLVNTKQEDLRISDTNEPKITIDNIEVAQFIYLLIKNEKLRTVIDTITSKVVLILGRFTPERMAILNLIRDELRNKNYLPILFDFENSPNRDITETVTTLALLSKFVVADITDPKSIPQELSQIIPHMTSLPIQPIILKGYSQYGMFEHFQRYPWVMDIIEYEDEAHLKSKVVDEIVLSCEGKLLTLRK